MSSAVRVLVASPLGQVIAKPLRTALGQADVEVATDEAAFVRCVTRGYRFDVVIADLIWNKPEAEWSFDGLDAIDVLRHTGRLAPVLLATQGHSIERDHLDEARLREEVCGIVPKADGLDAIIAAIQAAALGQRVNLTAPAKGTLPLYEAFVGQRGHTAGRLAGAIASGLASDNASLASVTHCSTNTARRVTSHYLGPIMIRRGDHDPALPLTQPSVFRWCGLHARYIISWCRRHGHGDVLAPI